MNKRDWTGSTGSTGSEEIGEEETHLQIRKNGMEETHPQMTQITADKEKADKDLAIIQVLYLRQSASPADEFLYPGLGCVHLRLS